MANDDVMDEIDKQELINVLTEAINTINASKYHKVKGYTKRGESFNYVIKIDINHK